MSRRREKPGRSIKTTARAEPGRPRWLGAAFLVGAIIVGFWLFQLAPDATRVAVEVPELSRVAQAGQVAFETNCASCHGPAAGGTELGPPLVHKWYEPSHHGDAAFVLAAKRGVPQHHWRFGNMPPQPQVGERSLRQIIAYVRELQRANGVE